MDRSNKAITYHGRTGKPVIHKTKNGRNYIMVRKSGGGVKRLYEGSKYYEEASTRQGKKTVKRLQV